MFKESQISQRLRYLKRRLKQENPLLADVVDSFRELDQVSRRLGFLNKEESHATRTSWWPLISILGIYSAGKSSFINHYLQYRLQNTGNQAVDDKFSVICFTNEDDVRVLPGLALDADPRFPFYKMSQAIEEVAKGEGQRIDAYLQLKTCPSEKLRGKIFIDSPGFDADAQRTSTLRITNRIIDLSDLVLVFFDARHPETGSMRDTLEQLVNRTISRRDSNKFLYILNQIDNTAQEDNTEEVFASWQRALAQYGLTAGCFYAIYIPGVGVPIEDDHLRIRFENKRDANLKEISKRIERVSEERAYRIVGMLEGTGKMLENEAVPRIRRFLTSWRRKVLWIDGIVLGLVAVAFLAATMAGGYWNGFSFNIPWLDSMTGGRYVEIGLATIVLLAAGYFHFSVRRWIANRVSRKFLAEITDPELHDNYSQAFHKNSRWYRSVFFRRPAGWGRRTRRRLADVFENTNAYIQKLNDTYTNPSGDNADQAMGTSAGLGQLQTPGGPPVACDELSQTVSEPAEDKYRD
jgi:hypothetical protein